MCTEMQDFDLECQGAYRIVEQWRASPALRAVWALEDVIALYNKHMPRLIAAYEGYCETGELPEKVTLLAVIGHLIESSRHGRHLIQIAKEAPAICKFDVTGVAELESLVAKAQSYVDEENQWAELEKAGPDNATLLKFATEHRAPQAWYDESIERL